MLRRGRVLNPCLPTTKDTEHSRNTGFTSISRPVWRYENGAALRCGCVRKPCMSRTNDTEHSRNTGSTSIFRPAWWYGKWCRVTARPRAETVNVQNQRHGTLTQHGVHLDFPPRLAVPKAVPCSGAAASGNRVCPEPTTRNTHATRGPPRIYAPPGGT